MRSIYLVRHPATPWSGLRYAGRTYLPLSLAGQRQARALATILASHVEGTMQVVSSPLARAATAARRIAEAGSWPIVYDDRWREADFGAEGATFGDVQLAWPDVAARLLSGELSIDWPDGEPFCALEDRVRMAWEDVLDIPVDSVVVVTHGGPLALALKRMSGEQHVARAAPGEVVEVLEGDGGALAWRWRPRR